MQIVKRWLWHVVNINMASIHWSSLLPGKTGGQQPQFSPVPCWYFFLLKFIWGNEITGLSVLYFFKRLWRKMNAIQLFSVTLLSVLAANAQVIMPGRCPKATVQENFDAAGVRILNFVVWETMSTFAFWTIWPTKQKFNTTRFISNIEFDLMCFFCSILVHGMKSRDCHTLFRKASAALPPTAWIALELLVFSTGSCCKHYLLITCIPFNLK